ncbi:GTP-binding protein [Porticoccus sp. W117]|uniref:CobW family GTP-binding protein n=1 Tax=Porticoccus sp. W117 TaxID=3054777 RepID=UPI002594EDD0|nr:GTP-binding protein [Porticoccus sp. W117]MDM3870006.1 GTP-binding protein [Porticoccus sp. W117]
MNKSKERITVVPTNIITGFLGVGKTSAILHLLKSKPDNERWAVLVNEFGEIGVDGSLFQGQHSEGQEVYIREVPGGCMCCAAGLPMQIALNQLLARAKPHRLLIEPTGLGHPIEVLEALTADHYQDVLSIQKIITLVDARKLEDSRYTEHATFNQQIAIADVIVGNKQDLYQPEHKAKLKDYAKSKAAKGVKIIFTEQGELAMDVLDGLIPVSRQAHHHHQHHKKDNAKTSPSDDPIPSGGFIKAVNQGEGFHSIGWRFDPVKTFCRDKLAVFLNGIVAERMKAVFITEDGVYGYNLTSDALTEIELNDCLESRIEIIAGEIPDQWEEQLFACIVNSEALSDSVV